jgi:hypothetical protein
MRILVCGGRDFENKGLLYETLDNICLNRGLITPMDKDGNWLPDKLVIVHGAAKGADVMAGDWACVNWVAWEAYPADWAEDGIRAGVIRNQKMLDTGIDLVVAVPTKNSRGTYDMINRAKKAGVEVMVIKPD